MYDLISLNILIAFSLKLNFRTASKKKKKEKRKDAKCSVILSQNSENTIEYLSVSDINLN